MSRISAIVDFYEAVSAERERQDNTRALYDAPPLPIWMTEAQRERLYVLARVAYAKGESALRSWSQADRADSEVFFCERRVYVAVASGTPFDAAFAAEETRWRKYAAFQAEKVSKAAKINGRNHPSGGLSVIGCRWVNPHRFGESISRIRSNVDNALRQVEG